MSNPSYPTNTYPTNTTTSASTQSGYGSGKSLGETVKDGWKVFHGAGEEIRGKINSGLDGVGDSIADRRVGYSEGDAVAAHGAAEAETGRMGIEAKQAEREMRR